MRFLRFLCGCSLLLGLPLSAAAQHAPVARDMELEDELSPVTRTQRLAQLTGRPIFAIVSADWCGNCVATVKRLQSDPRITPLSSQFLVLVLELDSEHHQRWKRQYPLFFPGVPIVGVAHPDGTLIYYRGGGFHRDQFADFLRQCLKRVGRILTPAELERVTLIERNARLAFLAGDPETAVRQLSSLRKIAPLGQLHCQAEAGKAVDALVAQLTELAQSELEDVEHLLAEPRPGEAARRLLAVRRVYGILPEIEKVSSELLERMTHDPEFQVALRAAQEAEESEVSRRPAASARVAR